MLIKNIYYYTINLKNVLKLAFRRNVTFLPRIGRTRYVQKSFKEFGFGKKFDDFKFVYITKRIPKD
jgi:hypothetical protein